MPNHVTNHISFKTHWMMARAIVNSITVNGKVDFNTLIPMPLHVYLGPLSSHDERDFKINWNSWNRENWGTKWNAYNTRIAINGGDVDIYFETAWRPPYPFIVAFFNKWGIPFVFESLCEGVNFAIREKWGTGPNGLLGNGRLSYEDYSGMDCMDIDGNPLIDMMLRLEHYDPRTDEYVYG